MSIKMNLRYALCLFDQGASCLHVAWRKGKYGEELGNTYVNSVWQMRSLAVKLFLAGETLYSIEAVR